MGQDVRNCEACLLSYHLECWQLNGGCGTYGCGKAPGGKGLVPDANTLRIDLPKVQGSAKEDLDPSGVPVGKITPIRDRVRTGQSGTEIGHAETLAVLSLVLGILSFFALALFFGPGAIVCGAIAGSKGKTMGWIGMALGIIGTVWWVQILMSSGA
ncbi:hypothetical protein HQ520_07030 [bacterium]|nr:hypothetical protein [bacterium]